MTISHLNRPWRRLDARALFFGVLATMGSLISIALSNDLALGASVLAVIVALAATTVIGAGVAALADLLGRSIVARVMPPRPIGTLADRDHEVRLTSRGVHDLATVAWVSGLLAVSKLLRNVFTNVLCARCVLGAIAIFVIGVALGTVAVGSWLRHRMPVARVRPS